MHMGLEGGRWLQGVVDRGGDDACDVEDGAYMHVACFVALLIHPDHLYRYMIGYI